jgi:lysophospholipase L1-like esterase
MMKLSLLEDLFSIVKLPSTESVPAWATQGKWFSVTRTDDELSIVCPSSVVPGHTSAEVEEAWRCIRVNGLLDFGLTGILAALAQPLAENHISIFAVSTYNTDYLLVKSHSIEKAVSVLEHAGHNFEPVNPAVIPVSKLEEDSYDWWDRHAQVLERQGGINPEIVLIGDSITHFWWGEPASESPHGTKESWEKAFGSRRVLNLGFGWDRTQNVLWRLDHGEMEGLHPKAVVINIGTNNTSETEQARANTPPEIRDGMRAVCQRVRTLAPEAAIILMAVFPREEQPDHPRRKLIRETNILYRELAEELQLRFLDIGSTLLAPDGTLSSEIAFDYCHLTGKGYMLWADALHPVLDSVFAK